MYFCRPREKIHARLPKPHDQYDCLHRRDLDERLASQSHGQNSCQMFRQPGLGIGSPLPGCAWAAMCERFNTQQQKLAHKK
jgi:hypothetical protein